MLGSLKEKIGHLHEGLASTVRGQLGAQPPSPPDVGKEINFSAGADLLEQYQNNWEAIHMQAEQAARQADRCSRLVSQFHAEYDKQWRHVSLLSCLVGELPQISKQVGGILVQLASLHDTFREVELSLLTLEETLDARDAQEKLLELRVKEAQYQERRRHALQEVEHSLEAEHTRRLKLRENQEREVKKERQSVFQQQFDKDLDTYRRTGFLEVPLNRATEASLESINLSEDEEDLEAFLQNESLSSPIPAPTQLFPDSQKASVTTPSTLATVSTSVTRDTSLYFTPDLTVEDLQSSCSS